MENVPDIKEAITRFNQGYAVFERCLESAQALNLRDYEAASRTAWTEVVGALEWAVKYCLERFYSERMTADELKKVDEDTFDQLLRRLARHAQHHLNRQSARDLHACRKWRNRTTHEAALAPHHELRNAFAAIRRFLTGHLPVQEEQLSGPSGESGGEVPVTAEAQLEPTYRQEGADWISRVFREGVERLRHERTQRYDATIASLETQAPELLTRQALSLLTEGQDTSGTLAPLWEGVEGEVREILLRGRETGVTPSDTERLNRLVPLITRSPALCLEAGWLRRNDEGLCFAHPHLPAVLVGRYLAGNALEAGRLSEYVGRDRSWAEAAWMAVFCGDDLSSWAMHLLAERKPLRLVERVVVTCTAFSATPPRTAASEEMSRAYRLCLSALTAFAPRFTSPEGGGEPDSPWFLPRELWWRCVLGLARASHPLDAGLDLSFDRDGRLQAPSPLAEVLAALALPSRLSAEESRALFALCAPLPAARRGMLDKTFFEMVFRPTSRVGELVKEPFLEHWMRTHGIPALMHAGGREPVRALTLHAPGHPAGYLLNQPSLLRDWFQAWLQLTSLEPEDSCRAWVEAILRLAGLHDSSEVLRELLLVDCLKRLEALGLRARALHELRQAYLPVWPRIEGDENGEEFRTNVAILRLLGLTASEWTAHIEAGMDRPALGWRTLLAAGAPHTAIANWCLRKLLEREQAPEAYRHGPVGIVASNMQVMRSGSWQLAFQQAPEALGWLLAEGDASALGVLADACLGTSSSPVRCDPPMEKVTGLTRPLSMLLWGRVLSRRAGREALYDRVERNTRLGEMHFLDSSPIPEDECQLWLKLVFEFWKPRGEETQEHLLAGTPLTRGAEAQRLLTCFERRLGWGLSPDAPGTHEPWTQAWPDLTPQVIVVACAAAQGVDVSNPLQRLFEQMSGRTLSDAPFVTHWLGHSLLRLSEYHPARAHPLLDRALSTEQLKLMDEDVTSSFWTALIRRHGSHRVLSAVDELGPREIGLGLVDALMRLEPQALRERELRPELLRPLLMRASEGAYTPSPRFWVEAWQVERGSEEIPELPRLPAGTWLKELLDQSTRWTPASRQSLLQHLARQSADERVRSQCLAELLAAPDV